MRRAALADRLVRLVTPDQLAMIAVLDPSVTTVGLARRAMTDRFAMTAPPVPTVRIAHRETSLLSVTVDPFVKAVTLTPSPSSIVPRVPLATTARRVMTVPLDSTVRIVRRVMIAHLAMTAQTARPVTIAHLDLTVRIVRPAMTAHLDLTARTDPFARTAMTVRRVPRAMTVFHVTIADPLVTTDARNVPRAAIRTSTLHATRRRSTSPAMTSCSSASRRWQQPQTMSRV